MIVKMVMFSLLYQNAIEKHERDPRKRFVSYLQATLLKQKSLKECKRISC